MLLKMKAKQVKMQPATAEDSLAWAAKALAQGADAAENAAENYFGPRQFACPCSRLEAFLQSDFQESIYTY